jgi:predicted transcriptional regulator
MKKIPKTTLNLRIDCDMIDRLKTIANKENRTLSNLVETMFLDYLNPESRRLAPQSTPNAETRAAMAEARRGGLRSYATVAEMHAALDDMDDPPFNAESIATFEATDRGEGLTVCDSADDMFSKLCA